MISRFRKLARKHQRSPFDEVDSSGDIRVVRRQTHIVLIVQALRLGIFMGTQAILPFLLVPTDFGRLYLVQIPMSLCYLFGDFGIAEGLVRVKVLTQELASLLFWLSIGIAVLATMVMLATVPLFELWYQASDLGFLTLCFGILMIVRAGGGQYRSMLRRQLRLKKIGLLEFLSSVLGNGAVLVLAMVGMGASSIPLGMAFGGVVEILGAIAFCGWIPGRFAPIREAKKVLRFGVGLSMSGAIFFGGSALSRVLLGRYFSESFLGLFERAEAIVRGVFERLQQLSTRLIYPLLSRRYSDRDSVEDLARPLRDACFRIWLPIICTAAIMVEPVFDRIYESTMPGLGRYAFWIVVSSIFFLPGQLVYQSLLAHGRTGYLVWLNSIRTVLHLIAAIIAIVQGSLLLFVMLSSLINIGNGIANLVLIPRVIGWVNRGFLPSLLSGGAYALPPIFTFSVLHHFGVALEVAAPLALVVLGAMLTGYIMSSHGGEVRRIIAS